MIANLPNNHFTLDNTLYHGPIDWVIPNLPLSQDLK